MGTIKSFTDIPQSKILSNILSIESADMYYHNRIDIKYQGALPIEYKHGNPLLSQEIAAWSLAALLSVIPKDESIDCSISFGYYNGKGEYIAKWLCTFEKENETKDGFIIETIDGDDPIDVLYEMILELNKLKMLLL